MTCSLQRPRARILDFALACAFFCLISGLPTGVTVNRQQYSAADIRSGARVVPTQLYIVGVTSLEARATLLEDMKAQFPGWEPTYLYTVLKMFTGTLENQHVLWLLDREEVRYIEEDAQVSIANGGGQQPQP